MRQMLIRCHGIPAAIMTENEDGSCVVRYLPGYEGSPFSFRFPVSPDPINFPGFPPFMSNLLPEGKRLVEAAHGNGLPEGDRFAILACLGRNGTVGALSFEEIKHQPSLTLALDLEGTLMSGFVSGDRSTMDPGPFTPRPGLWDFLEWAKTRFSLVVFTGVPPVMARKAMGRTVLAGAAPAWFAELPLYEADPPYEEWKFPVRRRPKDLGRIGPLGTVLMLDDNFMGHFVSGQVDFWIEIHSFRAADADTDTELTAIRPEIEALAAKLAAKE